MARPRKDQVEKKDDAIKLALSESDMAYLIAAKEELARTVDLSNFLKLMIERGIAVERAGRSPQPRASGEGLMEPIARVARG